MTIADGFDPRRNALNALRLALALLVIVWHSIRLTGYTVGFAPGRELFENIAVDGFFAISGFLITASWLHTPRVGRFLLARVLRIFPAFWVMLIFVACICGPMAMALNGWAPGYWHDAWRFMARNSLLWTVQFDIAGTPAGVPYPHAWNGSMWTLGWEFLCYLGVLALGMLRLLRRPAVVAGLFLGAEALRWSAALGVVDNYYLVNGSRFAVMFLAGALIYLLRHRIPLRTWIVVACLVVVVGSAWLPSYLMVAGLPLAYLMISVGTLKRPVVRNDLSYGTYIFAFPIQQLLATSGAWRVGPVLFAPLSIAAVLPVAALSWFGVEKRALRWKSYHREGLHRHSVRVGGLESVGVREDGLGPALGGGAAGCVAGGALDEGAAVDAVRVDDLPVRHDPLGAG